MAPLGELHSKHILTGFLDLHRQLSEIEALLAQSLIASPFSPYFNDLSPVERKVLADYFSRIRSTMLACLDEAEIPLTVRKTSIRWGVQTRAVFLSIALAEMSPDRLQGYGELSSEGQQLVVRIMRDLDRLVDRVSDYLREGSGQNLADRLAHLDAAAASLDTLKLLDRIVDRWQLVEFRPVLETIVARLESPEFEIAVFGRVSSGKSSLLNHIAGLNVLPVGVNPITAVPTRMVRGSIATVTISFAEFPQTHVSVNELQEYASEEGNPGNRKHVTEIRVRLPSERLAEGVVLVDTPGLGSLARAGAAETLAYLPRCDLGVLLVDAASTLNEEDMGVLHALYRAGTPAQVLLSKADLLSQADRQKAAQYIVKQLRDELGLELPVHPVSTVAADERLLTDWFDRQIHPLFDRNRVLAEASLQRKMAVLREAVAAALSTMIARQRGTKTPATKGQMATVRQLIEEGDALAENAKNRARDWSSGVSSLVSMILDQALHEITANRNTAAHDGALISRLDSVLAQRISDAQSMVIGLQEGLAHVLNGLSHEAGIGGIDPAAVASYTLRGLPPLDQSKLAVRLDYRPPAWSTLLPVVTEHVVQRALNQQFKEPIESFVLVYDRQLQAWLKHSVSQLTELYQAQAEATREQARRLSSEPSGIAGPDLQQLESDLNELKQSILPARAP